jgi:hypothetical protein
MQGYFFFFDAISILDQLVLTANLLKEMRLVSLGWTGMLPNRIYLQYCRKDYW